jgi:hypothetical protein
MRNRPVTSADRRKARDALSAGKRAYAASLRHAGATQCQIGFALGISPQRVGQLLAKASRLAAQPRWHAQFPARVLNYLIISGLADLPEIEAAEALARLAVKDLKETPNLGKDALAALAAWLARHGLALAPTNEERRPSRRRSAFTVGRRPSTDVLPLCGEGRKWKDARRHEVPGL